jgi:hypothetical protein
MADVNRNGITKMENDYRATIDEAQRIREKRDAELADAEKRALELKLRIDNLRMFIDNESGLTAVWNRGAVGPQDDTVEISMGGVSKTVSFSAALKFAGFIQRLA